MGSIWEGFGTLWAVLWPLLGSFWPFLGGSKSHLFKALVQDGLPNAFWRDFGSIWEGFGTVLERSGVIFGMVLGRFWKRFDI